jgi:protein SCO1/2
MAWQTALMQNGNESPPRKVDGQPWPAFLLVLALCSIAMLQTGCNSDSSIASNDSNAGVELNDVTGDASVAEADNGGAVASSSEMKVYGKVPQFELTNQDDQAFDSHELDGNVWVANFFFCRCRSTCPEQSKQVAKLQKIDGVQLVSISVQPEFDTPANLRQYAQNYDADPSKWQFLTGARDSIWELSKKGFFLPVGDAPADEAEPIFHSSKLILVDADRQIRGFYESQKSNEMLQLRKDLGKLVAVNMATPSPGDTDSDAELAELESNVKQRRLVSRMDGRAGSRAKEDGGEIAGVSRLSVC